MLVLMTLSFHVMAQMRAKSRPHRASKAAKAQDKKSLDQDLIASSIGAGSLTPTRIQKTQHLERNITVRATKSSEIDTVLLLFYIDFDWSIIKILQTKDVKFRQYLKSLENGRFTIGTMSRLLFNKYC